MRTNVKFNNVKYVVKPEENVVICTMDVDLQLHKMCANYLYYDEAWLKGTNVLCNGTFKVKGVTKCSGGDKFDETVGKRIAEAKAKKQAFSIAYHIHCKIHKKLSSYLEEYKTLIEGCKKANNTEKEHIKYLSK